MQVAPVPPVAQQDVSGLAKTYMTTNLHSMFDSLHRYPVWFPALDERVSHMFAFQMMDILSYVPSSMRMVKSKAIKGPLRY